MVGDVRNAGRWVIGDSRSVDWTEQPKQVGRDTFATKEEAESFLPVVAVSLKHRAVPKRDCNYEIWRYINDRKRVKVVVQTFDTRDEAMAFMLASAAQIKQRAKHLADERLGVSPGASVLANDSSAAMRPAADSSDGGLGAGGDSSVVRFSRVEKPANPSSTRT